MRAAFQVFLCVPLCDLPASAFRFIQNFVELRQTQIIKIILAALLPAPLPPRRSSLETTNIGRQKSLDFSGTNHQEARENAELLARLEWWVESTDERSSAMGGGSANAENLKISDDFCPS
jgi:hypothetical protein